MTFFRTALTSAALLASASMAFADSVPNAEITGTYIHAPDDGFAYQLQLEGAVAWEVAPDFTIQSDVHLTHYEGSDLADYEGYLGLHGIYDVSSAFNVGFGVGVGFSDDSSGDNYAALTAQYLTGAWLFTGLIGADTDNEFYQGLEAAYAFGGSSSSLMAMSAYFGFLGDSDSLGWTEVGLDNAYIGLRAEIAPGFELDTRLASMDEGEYRYFSIGITRVFGEGVRRDPINFNSFFPGY